MGEPGGVDGYQAHQRGYVHHFGAGAAVGGDEGVLAGQLLLDVFFEAAHGFEAGGAGVGPVLIAGQEVDFALRQALYQRNELVGAGAGGLDEGGVALRGQSGVAHNIAQVHHGEGAGLPLQGGAQQLEAGGGQFGLGGVAQQENGVGRGGGLGGQRPGRKSERSQRGKE